MHAKKSLLFENNNAWMKKGNEGMFDVTMGSYDGAEICELVGLYILNELSHKYGNDSIGLYRDDGLAVFNNTSGPQSERIRKDITRCFKDHGLKITIKANLKIANYLDITFNLTNGTYYPYIKPNDTPLYINTKSNHPPTIIRHLPGNINRRISDISCNQDVFDRAKTRYDDALQASGYQEKLTYNNNTTTQRRRNRKRKAIWYNPPFNKAVLTNIGKNFLLLIDKHFPTEHRLHKIFNKNTVKVSYSCTQNMASIIKKHNNKIINDEPANIRAPCNCRKKEQCPLENNCLTSSIVYNALVSTEENTPGKQYIGLTEGTFKQRYTQHKHSFQHKKHANSTELSKYIWNLKDNNKEYTIKWSTIAQAKAYNNRSKRCNLCLSEKFCILKARNPNLLNKRNEMISKCRHENKFYIKNYKQEVT